MRVARLRAVLGAAAGLVLVGLLGAPRADAETLDPRTIHATTLSNGLRLVVCEDEAAPVVSAEVVVKVGSADEAPEEGGLAHLLEHLCWIGDARSDPRAAIEDAGGSTNAGTLRDFTRYYATVQPSDYPTALRSLAAMVLRDSFDEGVISREQAVIQEEVASRNDRSRAVLNDLAFEALFGSDHPYGRRIEGEEKTLVSFTNLQVGRFHRAWYLPNNMAVVVGGKITFEEARAEVERAFGSLLPAAIPSRDGAEGPALGGGKERVAGAALKQVYLMAAFAGPAVSDPSSVAATDVLTTLLANPQVGRLVTDLQGERGLVKGVGVDFLTQRAPGLFGIWAICDRDKIAEVKAAITQELARLATEPVPRAELATAKRLLAAEFAFANETVAERVSTLSFYEALGSYRVASEYLPMIHSVTPADVARAAQRFAADPIWVALGEGGAP